MRLRVTRSFAHAVGYVYAHGCCGPRCVLYRLRFAFDFTLRSLFACALRHAHVGSVCAFTAHTHTTVCYRLRSLPRYVPLPVYVWLVCVALSSAFVLRFHVYLAPLSTVAFGCCYVVVVALHTRYVGWLRVYGWLPFWLRFTLYVYVVTGYPHRVCRALLPARMPVLPLGLHRILHHALHGWLLPLFFVCSYTFTVHLPVAFHVCPFHVPVRYRMIYTVYRILLVTTVTTARLGYRTFTPRLRSHLVYILRCDLVGWLLPRVTITVARCLHFVAAVALHVCGCGCVARISFAAFTRCVWLHRVTRAARYGCTFAFGCVCTHGYAHTFYTRGCLFTHVCGYVLRLRLHTRSMIFWFAVGCVCRSPTRFVTLVTFVGWLHRLLRLQDFALPFVCGWLRILRLPHCGLRILHTFFVVVRTHGLVSCVCGLPHPLTPPQLRGSPVPVTVGLPVPSFILRIVVTPRYVGYGYGYSSTVTVGCWLL